MRSKSSQLLAAAAAAPLLCAGSVSRAQEEPRAPAPRSEPAPVKAPAAKTPAAKTPAAKAPATATAKSTTTPATTKPAAARAGTPAASPAKSTTPAKTTTPTTAAAPPAAGASVQPAKIRICDPDNAGWCWTYTRNGDHYDGVGEHGGNRTLTLETFTTGSVVMRVTQAGKAGWSSVNSGTMTGNGIELGEWSDNAGHKGRITASWDAVTQSPSAGTRAAAAALRAPARPGAGAPHTNVETTEGLEKRAAARTRPAAATAAPTTEPPR